MVLGKLYTYTEPPFLIRIRILAEVFLYLDTVPREPDIVSPQGIVALAMLHGGHCSSDSQVACQTGKSRARDVQGQQGQNELLLSPLRRAA